MQSKLNSFIVDIIKLLKKSALLFMKREHVLLLSNIDKNDNQIIL